MEQTDFLSNPPIARRTDPGTSKVSAIEHSRTGKRRRDQIMLLELVEDCPGHTAMELADILIGRGIPWLRAYQVCNKRISDLAQLEFVHARSVRKCRISGRQARTWQVCT